MGRRVSGNPFVGVNAKLLARAVHDYGSRRQLARDLGSAYGVKVAPQTLDALCWGVHHRCRLRTLLSIADALDIPALSLVRFQPPHP